MDEDGTAWKIGESVPWSVAWSGEQKFRLQRSATFPGMVEVDQIDRPGDGEPIFAAVHVGRQRRGMVEHLCHVCGKPTAKGERWMFLVASGGLVDMGDGTRQYGCNVPPLHLACAKRARAQCPHLARLMDEPMPCPADEGRLIQRTDVVPGMEALALSIEKTRPKGVEVVFACYRLYAPSFTRRVERIRKAWERSTRARRAATSG